MLKSADGVVDIDFQVAIEVCSAEPVPGNVRRDDDAGADQSHHCARRDLSFGVLNHFPEDVEHVIALYSKIWVNEHVTVEEAMSPKKRLAYHRKHSQPVMVEIKDWGRTKLKDETVEENSGLGKAIRYFIKHYDGLTCFCRVEGAMLDNNLMEAQLKLIVRNRKNAGPFRTGCGAWVGDVITSMIATAAQAGINPVNYFTYLQRNADKVKSNPERYLPWDFKENG